MIKIKIIRTGEIKEVERNIAFDLIDRKEAQLYNKEEIIEAIKPPQRKFGYRNRQARTQIEK